MFLSPRRLPMAVAEAHPSAVELASFTLGALDDDSLAAVESHLAGCPACQERAAATPGDTLVELLRRAHTRNSLGSTTVAEAEAQVQTPPPLDLDAGLCTLGVGGTPAVR